MDYIENYKSALCTFLFFCYTENGDNKMIELILIVVAGIIIITAFTKRNIKVKNFHSNNANEFKEKLKEMNFPNEMISELDDQASTVVKTAHYSKVVYKNGEKVSEETKTTSNTIKPLTNCPNCGAKLENKTNNCPYCNTQLNTYQIN